MDLLNEKIISFINSTKILSVFCYTFILLSIELVAMTPSAEILNKFNSVSFKSILTIFSIPLLPNITGTPIHKSLSPNSPSNKEEQGNIFCFRTAHTLRNIKFMIYF